VQLPGIPAVAAERLLLRIDRDRQLVGGAARRHLGVGEPAAPLAAGRRVRRDRELLHELAVGREHLDAVLAALADVDVPVLRDLHEVEVGDEVLLRRRRSARPRVGRDRLVRDLAQRHAVAAPPALVRAGRGVVDQHALLLNDVQLIGDLVELEAPLVAQEVRLLVVLRHHPRLRRRTMVEVPHELAVAGELQDAVLRRGAGDPDEPFRVGDHRLHRRRPPRVVAGAAPRVDDVALLIELDHLRGARAALDARRIVAAADLVALRRLVAVDEPDVVHVVDVDAGDLLHAPAVRQRLRPERVHPELRGAALVDGLRRRRRPSLALRQPDVAARQRQRAGHRHRNGPRDRMPRSHRRVLSQKTRRRT
jgi:hypothetical protein